MREEEFENRYDALAKRVLFIADKARREGLLALEEVINHDAARNRNTADWLLDYGLCFVVDGMDALIIDKIMTNIVNLEKDEDERLLKISIKEAVLDIQEGINPRVLDVILNSYVDFGFDAAYDRYMN
jgi:flagellar motor component MotA